ncbi:MAG: ATP-binding protein [Ignavibacteria bacterium]|jgi:serine/threonine-protein kinase RsbW|nr:ATP-binding protein [Ignavibacteria bacterium]
MKQFELYEKYPNNRKSISLIEKDLRKIKHILNLSETIYYSIYLCVYEAFINAVFHGNRLDITKHVDLNIYFDDNVLTIKIIDSGDGFALHELPDPLNPNNLLKDSGRGIFIINHYTDQCKFEKTYRGFCVTIKFTLERSDK